MSFTCPRCHWTSHNPNDEREGWCSACGGVTGTGHEPWTPQSIWDAIDLPDDAYERMARGGVWRVQEPVPPVPPVPLGGTIPNNAVVRLVNYKFGRMSGKLIDVLGCWEGSNEWKRVGYAEYTG